VVFWRTPKEQKCTHYACVGDVVVRKRECLKIVRDMGMPCVKATTTSIARLTSNWWL